MLSGFLGYSAFLDRLYNRMILEGCISSCRLDVEAEGSNDVQNLQEHDLGEHSGARLKQTILNPAGHDSQTLPTN